MKKVEEIKTDNTLLYLKILFIIMFWPFILFYYFFKMFYKIYKKRQKQKNILKELNKVIEENKTYFLDGIKTEEEAIKDIEKFILENLDLLKKENNRVERELRDAEVLRKRREDLTSPYRALLLYK